MTAKTIEGLPRCDCKPAIYRNPDDLLKLRDVHSSVCRSTWLLSATAGDAPLVWSMFFVLFAHTVSFGCL